MGDGTRVRFWKDTWVGDQLLAAKLPRLYNLSAKHKAQVSLLTHETEGKLTWNSLFKNNNLSDRESYDMSSLLSTLESIQLLP